jgi:hypothetical protein
MTVRYEHATQDRDRFIAHALEDLAQSVPVQPNRPAVTVDDHGERARSAHDSRHARKVQLRKRILSRPFPRTECAPRDLNPKPAD